MNVAYHSSDLFASVLGISICSLFENNKEIDVINVYVIEHNISVDNKVKLEEIANKYGRSIYFIPMPDINVTEHLNLKKVKNKWLFDSYCRLFLHHLLPKSVERVLYLDGDVLVVDSLKELWEFDLQGKCAAAVAECLSEKYYNLFCFDKDSRYCNSGVILYDLKEWNNLKMDEEIRRYIRKNNGYVFFMEQTVFSYITQGKLYTLPLMYNLSSIAQLLNYRELFKLRKFCRFYSKEEFELALSRPKIVHMTSSFLIVNRAWNEITNHPMKADCRKYAFMSPWGLNALSKDNRSNIKKLLDLFINIVPNVFLLSAVSFVYNTLRVKFIEIQMNKFKDSH